MFVGPVAPSLAQSLADAAKRTGCVDTPRVHPSDVGMYTCKTEFGTGFFSVDSGPGRRPSTSSAKSPTNFPKVDAPTQRARDGDRRKILEQELGNEERMLADARRQLEAQQGLLAVEGKAPAPERLGPYQKQVQLHENNIANLRKELANLK